MGQVSADITQKDVEMVTKNIAGIVERKKAAAFALAQSLAVQMLNEFRERQSGGEFWTNQTEQAFQRVFTNTGMDAESIFFFIAHGVEYGVYLELANDRKHEALRPLALKYAAKFTKGLKEIF